MEPETSLLRRFKTVSVFMLYAYFSANPRAVFLVDGMGALLSTIFLLLIAYFEALFGMPKTVLYWLVPVSALFTVYSLGSYMLHPAKWKRYLTVIAMANVLYSLLTAVLVVYHIESLTPLGKVYFIAEILVVLGLSIAELCLVYKGHR